MNGIGRALSLCILTVFIMVAVSACMFGNKRGASLDDRMMEYINARYDDTFTYIERKSGMYTNTDKRILVRSEKYPDEEITVRIVVEDGVDFLNDNYLYFVYREQTIAYLEALLAEALTHDFKFYYEAAPDAGAYKLSADATFEEYITDKASCIRFVAVLAPGYDLGDRDAFTAKMKEAFTSRDVQIQGLALRFSEDPEAYESLTEETFTSFLDRYEGPIALMSLVGREGESIFWKDVGGDG